MLIIHELSYTMFEIVTKDVFLFVSLFVILQMYVTADDISVISLPDHRCADGMTKFDLRSVSNAIAFSRVLKWVYPDTDPVLPFLCLLRGTRPPLSCSVIQPTT